MRLLDDQIYLSATIGRIYDCALRPELWQNLILELQELIGGCRSMIQVISPGGQALLVQTQHGTGPDDPGRQYLTINPLLPYGLIWPFDKAFRASSDFGMERLRATRYYKEYLSSCNTRCWCPRHLGNRH
jgi:hypothetical protein